MAVDKKRVVVMMDASRELSVSAIGWVLEGFSLLPGDELTLLAILHQVNNPSTLSITRAGKLLGYKSKIDSSSMFGANQRVIEDERARKEEEYQTNEDIIKISKLCKTKKIEFHLEVLAGPSPTKVALKAAISLDPTWIILDRQVKKEKKQFLERLSCGISKMKRDNTIEELRGPKELGVHVDSKSPTESASSQFTYDEMIPGFSPEEEETPKKFQSPTYTSLKKRDCGDSCEPAGPWHSSYKKYTSLCKSTSSEKLATKSVSSFRNVVAKWLTLDGMITTNAEEEYEEERSGEQSPFSIFDEHPEQQSSMIFANSICSICNNKRPRIGWKIRDFTYAELHTATKGFSYFLSEGGFGSVFKGVLADGIKIAVKQHKLASSQGEKEFKSEVHVLSKARHENLVMLLGSCSEGNHRLLVYEYVCYGSLDQHISKNSLKPLSWEKRMKIARGAAKGLQYLHENNIIHRDMRPNNILITHDHESLLGDFGLARSQPENMDHSLVETEVVGTLGYLAPEYAECGKVSTKTDVYAFGVVLLQLITGLTTTDEIVGGSSLVGWARPLLKERNYPDLIDPRIADDHDFHQLFWMVQLAEKCLSKDSRKRLTMDKVVEYLDYIMDKDNICGIRDFSPAESETTESQLDITSFRVQTASIKSSGADVAACNKDQAICSQISNSRAVPAESLCIGKNLEKKETSNNKNRLFYDQMVT